MAAFFLPNTWTDWIADMLSVVRSRRFVYLRDRGGLLPLLDGVDGVEACLRSRDGTSVSPSVRASRISPCVCWRAGVPLVPPFRSAQGRSVPRGAKVSCTRGRLVLATWSPRAALFANLGRSQLQLSTRHSLSHSDTAKDLYELLLGTTARSHKGEASMS